MSGGTVLAGTVLTIRGPSGVLLKARFDTAVGEAGGFAGIVRRGGLAEEFRILWPTGSEGSGSWPLSNVDKGTAWVLTRAYVESILEAK